MQAERFMKTFIPLQLLAVFTLAPVASAQEVITAALAGVPMTDEPDHHLVLNNDYVNAYDVEVPPHGSTRLHQHLHDNVFIVFGNAEVTNAVEGKTPVHLDLKDSSVNFRSCALRAQGNEQRHTAIPQYHHRTPAIARRCGKVLQLGRRGFSFGRW